MGVYNVNIENTHGGISWEERIMEEKNEIKEEHECCWRYKHTPRSDESLRQLRSRINRIVGQLGGIQKMLDENRYCGDILTQIAAAESALQGVGYILLKGHMQTCVAEQIKEGNTGIIDEAVELMRKLK